MDENQTENQNENTSENQTTNEPRIWQPGLGLDRSTFIKNSESHLLTSEEEFEKAFNIVQKYPRRVTIFGSARTTEDDKYYKKAYELGSKLAKMGYAVVTGGGGGIMEAANRGAKGAGGASIGFNIVLPKEQTLNAYTTEHLSYYYFFTRKVMMTFYAHAYVFFPGGFGTLDEFFEVLTLMQTRKMAKAPLALVGDEFWHNLDKFVQINQLAHHDISPPDEDIYQISEDLEAVCGLIANALE